MVQNKAVRIREERLASLIRQEADRKRKAESAQRLRYATQPVLIACFLMR